MDGLPWEEPYGGLKVSKPFKVDMHREWEKILDMWSLADPLITHRRAPESSTRQTGTQV